MQLMFRSVLFLLLLCLLFSIQVYPQDVTFFFSAGDLDGEPDRFGNVHTVTPMDAIDPRPFGNEDIADVFFDEDNLWLIYQVEANRFLVSHGPGFFEDAPEITMNITPAFGGRYEVILNFLDSEEVPGSGQIQAATGENDFLTFDANNSIRATGGTMPGYPTVGNTTQGNMFWYSAVLDEVDINAGDVIQVRIDDVQGDQLDPPPPAYVTTTFQGITLRVIELDGALPEVQISPGAYEWTTDLSGNEFRTWPLDETTYPNLEDWLTINARVDGSGLWNIRERLGPYGPILESFPVNGNDAMPLRTTIRFVEGGTYDAYFSIGDTGVASTEDNDASPNPLQVYREGEEAKTWVPNDGELKGTPGYNDYEIYLEQITVSAGEEVSYIVDDVQDYPNGQRSVYMGMRFLRSDQTNVQSWSLF